MELVLVPAWRRADFLLATLQRIAVADKTSDTEVWICLDRMATPDVVQVARSFQGARVRTVEHFYHGNSFNILSAYLEACALRPMPSLIHLIEDDIFIGHDYFEFHARAHELCPYVFAVSACRNDNIDRQPPADPTSLYTHVSYQSLGVSFRPEQLHDVLLHVRPEYFRDPVAYCALMFPGYRHGSAFAEQDGLIRRVAEFYGLPVAFGAVPRAYHAGFHGYNRKGNKMQGGTVQARAAVLLSMGGADLNRYAISHPDHETVDLDGERALPAYVIDWPEASYAVA